MSEHDLGNMILNKRLELRLSQEEFAKRVNEFCPNIASRSALSSIERGNVVPKLSIACAIVDVLKLDIQEMCTTLMQDYVAPSKETITKISREHLK